MMLTHVLGIPLEESVLQLAPAGAAIATAVTIALRTTLDRLRRSGRPERQRPSIRLSGVFRWPNTANAPDTSVPAVPKPLHDD